MTSRTLSFNGSRNQNSATEMVQEDMGRPDFARRIRVEESKTNTQDNVLQTSDKEKRSGSEMMDPLLAPLLLLVLSGEPQ